MFLGVKVSSLRLIAIVSGGYMRCTCWEGVKEVSSRGLLADSLQEVVNDGLIGTE